MGGVNWGGQKPSFGVPCLPPLFPPAAIGFCTFDRTPPCTPPFSTFLGGVNGGVKKGHFGPPPRGGSKVTIFIKIDDFDIINVEFHVKCMILM